MIFTRSTSPKQFSDYAKYRPYLRVDFCYRCAYCLRQEGHNGGEANFCIDHHQPVRGAFGKPDLECEYTNLYYTCCECNENKADKWPTEAQRQKGYRFLNPCQPEDDHSLHWVFHSNGTLEALTNVGKYTEIMLLLSRPGLQYWRAKMYLLQQKAEEIENTLFPQLEPQDRDALQKELEGIREQLEPPVFDRQRGKERQRLEEAECP